MTAKQTHLRRNLLARIHQHDFTKAAKEQDAWENFLFNMYKVSSSAKLSIDELYNLIDVLDNSAKPLIKGRRPQLKKEGISEAQQAYILKLWDDRDENSLREFCFRTTAKRYLHLNSLNKNEATKLILGLEYMLGVKKR